MVAEITPHGPHFIW